MTFNHLKHHNISYGEHFKNSMSYSFKSLKASLYFFIHAFIPDTFEDSGSKTIVKLSNEF